MPFYAPNIVFRMRWMVGIALLAIAAALPVALTGSRVELPSVEAAPAAAEALPSLNPSLAALAERSPGKRVEVIVQLNPGTTRADAAPLVRELGGKVTRDLHIINAVAAKLPAAGARELASRPEVRAVSPNGAIEAAGDGRRPRHELQPVDPGAAPVEHVPRHRPRRRRRGGRHRHRRRPARTSASPSTDKRSRVIGSAVVQPGRHHGDRHVRPRHARRGHHRRRLRQPRRRRPATRAASWASRRTRTSSRSRSPTTRATPPSST